MLFKQLFSIGIMSTILLSSFSSQKIQAHDPKQLGVIIIGGVMAAGGIYQICKEKGSKIGGLTLLAGGTAIVLGSDKIIQPKGFDLLKKDPAQFTQKTLNALSDKWNDFTRDL